jgi:hypothetical protein
MHHLLRHRGPDGEGCLLVDSRFDGQRLARIPPYRCANWNGLRAVAVVRRLRVSDLRAEADQPLSSRDGKVCDRMVEFGFSLPATVRERRQKKMFVGLINWMSLRNHAREIREGPRHPSFDTLPWLDAPRMRAFVDDFLAGRHENACAVWRIFTASRWFELFVL